MNLLIFICLFSGDKLWDVVATALKSKRIARKYRVKKDRFRSPNVELLKGTDGWVIHVDNKIKSVYFVIYFFSFINIYYHHFRVFFF